MIAFLQAFRLEPGCVLLPLSHVFSLIQRFPTLTCPVFGVQLTFHGGALKVNKFNLESRLAGRATLINPRSSRQGLTNHAVRDGSTLRR